MSWRTLFFRNKAFLHVEKDAIRVQQEQEYRVPLEDVACLVLESPKITLTSALLARAAENGIAIFTCGENHQPNGLLASFLPHSRQTEVLRMQLDWSKPFRKRCWQIVAQAKIRNQARCLELLGKPDAEVLRAMAARVQSGDEGNREAQAARKYFDALFGEDFRRARKAGDGVNSALNYGYAILRGAMARALCGSGFLPALGLHHDNAQNAFNLADDLLEPFRPFCDRHVALKQWPEDCGADLRPEDKSGLAAILGEDCAFGGEKQSILSAC